MTGSRRELRAEEGRASSAAGAFGAAADAVLGAHAAKKRAPIHAEGCCCKPLQAFSATQHKIRGGAAEQQLVRRSRSAAAAAESP